MKEIQASWTGAWPSRKQIFEAPKILVIMSSMLGLKMSMKAWANIELVIEELVIATQANIMIENQVWWVKELAIKDHQIELKRSLAKRKTAPLHHLHLLPHLLLPIKKMQESSLWTTKMKAIVRKVAVGLGCSAYHCFFCWLHLELAFTSSWGEVMTIIKK